MDWVVLCVRFQVLTATSVKMAVFWVVAPCSLVEVYLRFRGAYCLRIRAMYSLHTGSSRVLSWTP
jgi:hypothetical protein